MKPDEKAILSRFKDDFIKFGVVRWVFIDNGVKVTRKHKNIPKGVEYFRIDEWNG